LKLLNSIRFTLYYLKIESLNSELFWIDITPRLTGGKLGAQWSVCRPSAADC